MAFPEFVEVVFAILIGEAIAFGILYLLWKFFKWVYGYMNFMTAEDICIHEAGHYLAYIKYPYLHNASKKKFRKNSNKMLFMCQATQAGYVEHINPNSNEHNAYSTIGGLGTFLAIRNKRINRFGLWIHRYLRGCGSDIWKLRHKHNMSKNEIVIRFNLFADRLSDYDKEFVMMVAQELLKKKKETKKKRAIKKIRSFDKKELARFSEIYIRHHYGTTRNRLEEN